MLFLHYPVNPQNVIRIADRWKCLG